MFALAKLTLLVGSLLSSLNHPKRIKQTVVSPSTLPKTNITPENGQEDDGRLFGFAFAFSFSLSWRFPRFCSETFFHFETSLIIDPTNLRASNSVPFVSVCDD